jgi:hypothetical protein
MGAQTKAGYKPFSKGHLEAVVNPLKHSYVYDSANLFGNNPDEKAAKDKKKNDEVLLRQQWEKEKANNEALKSKKITFNEDTTLEGDL